MEAPVVRTSKPTVVGILNLVSGLFCLLGLAAVVTGIFAIQSDTIFGGFLKDLYPPDIAYMVQIIWAVNAVFSLVAVVFAALGTVYAFQRRKWILVLLGSIFMTMEFFPTGVPAIILTVMSKDEFN